MKWVWLFKKHGTDMKTNSGCIFYKGEFWRFVSLGNVKTDSG
jgi:hypothetical protein